MIRVAIQDLSQQAPPPQSRRVGQALSDLSDFAKFMRVIRQADFADPIRRSVRKQQSEFFQPVLILGKSTAPKQGKILMPANVVRQVFGRGIHTFGFRHQSVHLIGYFGQVNYVLGLDRIAVGIQQPTFFEQIVRNLANQFIKPRFAYGAGQ